MSFFLMKGNTTNYFYMLKNTALIITVLLFQFYEKCFNHKDHLNTNFKKIFLFCDKIFAPILKMINNIVKPLNIGSNIQLNVGSFIFMFILLIGVII